MIKTKNDSHLIAVPVTQKSLQHDCRIALKKGIHLDLNRVRKVLSSLGNPESSFASVLVAGTNGKGSVSAFLSSVLQKAQYCVGLFTSPHLLHVRERFQINGTHITLREFQNLQEKVFQTCHKIRCSLTEFEIQTVIAFLYFQKKKIDIAVVEVGMGGRLDATNAIPCPELSMITSIGYDHMEWLGNELDQIYVEKRGITRAGVPLIESIPLSLQKKSDILNKKKGVPFYRLGPSFYGKGLTTHWEKGFQNIEVVYAQKKYRNLKIPFLGKHQIDNAALAVGAAVVLKERGWAISDKNIREGLAQTSWPGRFMTFFLKKNGPRILIDGGHNEQSLRTFMDTLNASPWPKQKISLIYGSLKEKPVKSFVRQLKNRVGRVFTLSLPSPRSFSAEEVSRYWETECPVSPCKNFRQAWELAQESNPKMIVILGSLYLAGEALKFFNSKFSYKEVTP